LQAKFKYKVDYIARADDFADSLDLIWFGFACVDCRSETNPDVIKKKYYDGLNNLAIVKRQAAISQMFESDPVAVERGASAI
jgi:hypothetical protein